MPLSIEELEAKIAKRQDDKIRNSIAENQTRFPTVPPEVIEESMRLQHEAGRKASVLGLSLGIGSELGLGMYSSKKIYDAYKAGKIVNWASKVKNFSLLSQVGPQAAEPVSTATAVILAGIGQGIAWGGSNYLGQQIRKGYGLQDGISYGELLATGVFGALTGPSSRLGELANKTFMSAGNRKLLELTGKTAGDMKAYGKGGYIFKNGIKSFVGGASFGMAETAVRQELQIAMNERENRDIYEYLFAGGIGGAANTVLGAFAKAGAWGRTEQIRITTKAENRLAKEVETLKAEIKQIEKSGETGLFGRKLSKKKKQLKETEEAQDLLKNAVEEYNEQNAKIIDLETGKTKESYNDDVPTEIKKSIPEKVEEKNTGDILEEIEELRNQNLKVKSADLGEELAAREKEGLHLDDYEKEILDFYKQDPKVLNKIPTVDEPNLVLRATTITDELDDEISNEIARILIKEEKGQNALDNYRKLKFLFSNKEYAYEKILDNINTKSGRALQARQQRGANLAKNYSKNRVSRNTQIRRAAHKDLIETIDNKIKDFDSEAINVNDLRGKLAKLNQDLDAVKRANASLGKTAKKINRKPEVTKIAQKDSEAAIKRLEKQLDDLRKGDVDLGQPVRKVPKAVAKEEQILKDKIKFYRTSQKELVELDKLRKDLDDLVGMSPDEFKKLDAKERAKKKLLQKEKIKTKNDQIKEKIASIKKGLRAATRESTKKKRADLDSQFYTSMEKYYFETRNKGFGTRIKRFLNTATSWRQAALIDQLSSVVAGIPTGGFAVAETLLKPHTNLFLNVIRGRGSMAFKLYVGNLSSVAQLIHGMKDALKAGFLSAKRLQSVTDPFRDSKLGEFRGVKTGVSRSLRQAKINAERRVRAEKNIMNVIDKNIVTGNLWNLLALGLRGIIGVDEVFRRQIIKTRIASNARQKAILQNAKDPSKSVDQIEKELLDTVWKKNADGLDVLQETEDFITEINFGRDQLFYAGTKDNVGDVHYSIVNRFLDWAKPKTEYGNFALKIFIPFMDVVVRGVYRGARLTTLPVTAIPRMTFMNPYVMKIKELKDLKGRAEDSLEDFDVDIFGGTKAEYQAKIDEEIIDINKRIERLEIRKAEYNEQILADTVMGGTLLYLGHELARMEDSDGIPLITGGMSFLSPEQRKKFEERGIKPYTIFGLPYEAMIPFSLPMAFAADISYWQKLKEDKQLSEDQNFFNVAISAINNLARELPFNQGIKLLDDLLVDPNSENSKLRFDNAIANLVASYTPIPAQARKLQRIATGEGKIADLKGGSFMDRYYYMAFGTFPTNYKVNLFGEDLKSPQTPEQAILRFTPDRKEEITLFDEVVANDVLNIMPTEIKRDLITGVTMRDFLNEEGKSLHYEFAERLRRTNLKKVIERKIKTSAWKRKFRDGDTTLTTGGQQTNEGLVELEAIIREYWGKVSQDILRENKNFKNSFINKDEQTLFEVLKEKRAKVYGKRIERDINPLKISF